MTVTGNIMFGSSILAAAIPLVALVLPNSGATFGNPLNGNNNNKRNGGFFSLLANGGGGLQGRVESVMGWVERSVEHLPNFPRLHPQECVKRSICEAHNEPNKYGAIGLTLRVLFPAGNLNSTDQMDDMQYKVVNKYRHAASFGHTWKRSDENGTYNTAVCKDKYEDCLVSLLDVAQSLVNLFLK